MGIFGLGHLRGIKNFWEGAENIDLNLLKTPNKGFEEVGQLFIKKHAEKD